MDNKSYHLYTDEEKLKLSVSNKALNIIYVIVK